MLVDRERHFLPRPDPKGSADICFLSRTPAMSGDPTVTPGLKLSLRAGFWPDCYREISEVGPPACLRPVGWQIHVFSREQSGRNPARRVNFRPGITVVYHRVYIYIYIYTRSAYGTLRCL